MKKIDNHTQDFMETFEYKNVQRANADEIYYQGALVRSVILFCVFVGFYLSNTSIACALWGVGGGTIIDYCFFVHSKKKAKRAKKEWNESLAKCFKERVKESEKKLTDL